ncbi:MAG: hypothetical protein KGP28_11495, partial [Bdellovibrionales bacterium]|nr:hypothetical protein [Bdellovibrionales bacterium]
SVLKEKIKAGKIHALQYPISVTGLLIPAKPSIRALNAKPGDPLFGFMKGILSLDSDFRNFQGFWKWLGLHDYPKQETSIPYPRGTRPEYPMGVSLISRNGTEGFTLSCAACHSSTLFGKPILGLTNRFPRANLFFIHGQSTLQKVPPGLFSAVTGATASERAMYADSRDRIQSVGLKRPAALGLDTSLAQVALSIAKRGSDPWATRDPSNAGSPKPNILNDLVSDSKPAVWWNVKYKTRWLSDGSVLSGNPIFTNFLWNEIGRGADLPELVSWLETKSDIVEELTTAVFATEAPKWRDYLSESKIDVARAKQGQLLYQQSCANCHGTYEKAWSMSTPDRHPTDTVRTLYFEKTRVKDVGTDPGRRLGMRALKEALNPLEFSKRFNIAIEEQTGYVPPPLDGIWARFPYFHNNSIPNLCALMTPPEKRPEIFFTGEAKDPEKDFDQDCVGYPTGAKTPRAWRVAKDSIEHRFDTTRPGLSNAGHYERIFRNQDGSEKFTADQKKDLIEFLKTL